jgi:hypothetical protein
MTSVAALLDMMQFETFKPFGIVLRAAVLLSIFGTAAAGQDRRATVFGQVGAGNIGHADSEQGNALIVGGGAGFRLTPWLVMEADVHRAHVSNVFGQQSHEFTATTLTGSVLYRSHDERRAHLIAGGGLGVQRARSQFDVSPSTRVDRTETLRLLHGRIGAEWDVSDHVAVRTDGVVWFGGGLDWVLGGVVRAAYRF